MAIESSIVWFLIGGALTLSLISLLFAYLQVHYGLLVPQPFEPPDIGLISQFRSTKSPFTKIWVAFRWLYVRYIHSFFRSLFIRPELSLSVFALAPAVLLIGFWIQEGISIEPLVLATLFYASVVFFKEFFLADYPLVQLNRKLHSKDAEFKVTYEVANIGDEPVSNLSLSHQVYDGDGRWLRGSIAPLNFQNLSPIPIDPGKTSEEFRVPLEKSIGIESTEGDWVTVESDTETPIMIEISASPSIGHRFLGDREIIRFDPSRYPRDTEEALNEL